MFNIIFDMDGTLLDTQRICIPAWEECGKMQGIEGMGEKTRNLGGMNETGWTKFLEDNYPGLDIPRFKADLHEYYTTYNSVTRFMPGAKELLDFFKENNIKMAIASGSSVNTIIHHMTNVSALDYFDAMAGGLEVEKGKPEPDIFLLAAKRLGVNPETCFVFEDSPLGVIAAKKAGMKPIAVPDVVYFSEEVLAQSFAVLSSLEQAIPLFEKLIKENN